MKTKWRYLLLIPALVIPTITTWSLWIQDGGILQSNISTPFILFAIIVTAWAIVLGVQLLALIVTWE